MDAEKGKASTGVGVYVALLWVYDLLSQLNDVAIPTKNALGAASISYGTRHNFSSSLVIGEDHTV